MLPGYKHFRTITLSGFAPTGDPDWAGLPETYAAEVVKDTALFPVSLDIGNGRGALGKISIYAVLCDSAGALVNRGTMTFTLTPLEYARPGDPGETGVAGAEPSCIIDGLPEDSAPQQKTKLEIGPTLATIGVAVRDVQNVPGSAVTMRLYYRPAA